MPLTHAQQILAEDMTFVNFIQSTDETGREQYFYVAVQGNDMPAFSRALQAGSPEAKKLGSVLASGYGAPSKAVKDRMAQYGCAEDNMLTVLDDNNQDASTSTSTA